MPRVQGRPAMLFADVGRRGKYHVGDEALLTGTLNWARREHPGTTTVVCSGNPVLTAGREGVRSCPFASGKTVDALLDRSFTRALLRDPVRVLSGMRELREVRRCRLLHLCGGGYLTSRYSGMLRLATLYVRSAIAAGVPVAVTGVTVGPELVAEDAALLTSWLPHVDFLSVRDRESARVVSDLCGLDCRNISFDEAWAMEGSPMAGVELAGGSARPIVGLCLHGLDGRNGAPLYESVARHLQDFADRHGVRYVYIPHMVQSQGGDIEAGNRLKGMISSDVLVLEGLTSFRDARWAAGLCDFVITTRYHGLVFALSAGVPSLALYGDDYTKAKLAGPWDVLQASPCLESISSPGLDRVLAEAWATRKVQSETIQKSRCNADQALQDVRSHLDLHYGCEEGAPA